MGFDVRQWDERTAVFIESNTVFFAGMEPDKNVHTESASRDFARKSLDRV